MIELGIMAIIFLCGWMILSGLGMNNWGVIPLGFIVGTSLLIVVGFGLVVTGLPTYPWLMVLLGLAVAGSVLIWNLRTRQRLPLHLLVAGLALLIPLAALFRAANLVKYHIDSFRYLVGSGLLARDSFELATQNILETRLLSAPLVHSLADLNAEWYLQSHSPLLTLAILGLLVWAVAQTHRGGRSNTRVLVIGTMAVLLVATNNRMVWNSFYINDHLIFGGAFLVACLASWMVAREASGESAALVASLMLALPTLVVTRPEGFIAAALAVFPLLLAPSVSTRTRRVVLAAYASSTLIWFGFVSLARYELTGGFSATLTAPALAGLVGLGILPVLRWYGLASWRRRLLVAFEGGLWLALAAFTIQNPEILTQSLRATFENIARGAGSWGYSLIILGGISLLALALTKDRTLVHLRFPLTAFVPVFFLLAYLREGAYRVGNGDSLNRMLMHVVPVIVLYVAASALARHSDGSAVEQETSPGLTPKAPSA